MKLRNAIAAAVFALSLGTGAIAIQPANAATLSCTNLAAKYHWSPEENNYDALTGGCDWSATRGWYGSPGECSYEARKLQSALGFVSTAIMRSKGCPVHFEDGTWAAN